jgi:hypothetical protein
MLKKVFLKFKFFEDFGRTCPKGHEYAKNVNKCVSKAQNKNKSYNHHIKYLYCTLSILSLTVTSTAMWALPTLPPPLSVLLAFSNVMSLFLFVDRRVNKTNM